MLRRVVLPTHLRCFEGGLRVGKLEDVLLRWREHPRRSSRHLPAYRRDAFLRCKAHFLARGPLRQAQEVWLWGAGPIGRRLGHFLREQGVNLTAYLDIDPKKVGGHSRGIPIRHADTAYAPATGATTMVVAAVGARGARDLIRQRAAQLGWCEGTNFLCAA